MEPLVLFALVFTLALGVAFGMFLGRSKARAESSRLLAERDLAVTERRRTDADSRETRGRIEAEQRLRIEAETRLDATARALAEQQKFVEETKQQLENSFAALSQRALATATENLLTVARSQFEGTKGEITSSLETKNKDIEMLLTPLREMLEKYRSEVATSENSRVQAYGGLQEQIRHLLSAQETTQKETSKLVNALRIPNVRGSWGENTLRKCVEMAGMSEHCDFLLQETFSAGDEGRKIRPDLIIRLPNKRIVAVDSKAPIDAYLEAQSETDENRRRTLLEQHAKNLRKHIDQLSRKEYGASIGESLDFTLLFLGGEQFLSAALLTDVTIFEFAAERNIFLATPTILLPLLRAVEKGWKAERSEEHAREALVLGQELYDRFVKMFEHFEGIGSSLTTAVRKYNDAVRTIETRIIPKARQLQSNVDSRKEIPELAQIDQQPIDVPTLPVQTRIPLTESERRPQPKVHSPEELSAVLFSKD